MQFQIRAASTADAAPILAVYGPYIQNTAITFEYEIPSVESFAKRMEDIMARYPYLIAEDNGKVVGYAYAAPYITRSACDWSCEVSIYLSPETVGHGLGRALYTQLENQLRQMGIVNMYASIACADGEDPYVSNHSAEFHGHMGFRPIGVFRNCGYKFGRWYHLMWVEKTLNTHGKEMQPVLFGNKEK